MACGREQPAQDAALAEPEAPSVSARTDTAPRYYALRLIQAVYRVLAWVVLVGAPVVGVIGGAGGRPYLRVGGLGGAGTAPVAGFLAGLVVGAIGWLLLMVVAESVCVLIDTEENTRRTAEALARPRSE